MKKIILHLLSVFALTACIGSVISGQAVCDSDVSQIIEITGNCTRTIDTLEEKDTQRLAVQTADVMPFATVDFMVTVEQGTVDVTFVDSRGNTQTEQATPGNPATGSLPVQLDPLNQIKFDLTPVGGPAEGIEYELQFVCQCMP